MTSGGVQRVLALKSGGFYPAAALLTVANHHEAFDDI
jgi:hypothetical protein